MAETTEYKASLRRLRALATSLEVDTEQMYSAMGDITLWGDDTHEDFGNLQTVSGQVGMLYSEATSRLGAEKGYALAEKAIRAAREE